MSSSASLKKIFACDLVSGKSWMFVLNNLNRSKAYNETLVSIENETIRVRKHKQVYNKRTMKSSKKC